MKRIQSSQNLVMQTAQERAGHYDASFPTWTKSWNGDPPVIFIESDKYCIGCICAKRRAGGDIILEAGPENSHRELVYGWLHQVRLTPASVAEQEGAELDGGVSIDGNYPFYITTK